MQLKPEVVRALQRERTISQTAIAYLRARLQEFERRYGWPTEEFLQKFEAGQIGDEEDHFHWCALAQALHDWRTTHDSLNELLSDSDGESSGAPG